MRVIARSTLNGFAECRVEPRLRTIVKSHLEAWYREVKRATWQSSAELKMRFGAASIISSTRVAFNIKGNDYRMVVTINYPRQTVYILWLGTHYEYDRIDVAEVRYDERRYSNLSHPN